MRIRMHDVLRRGLDVEVGGAVGDGLLEQRVHELDDRAVVDERAAAISASTS